MASVSLKKITKRWGDFVGVDNQSLDIQDKEFLVLLGPSGCGKTTTMRMIAGLEEPTAGEIWIGDRMVNDDLPKDRDVAMVFQNYGLYPHMTVYDNIAYPLKIRGTPKSEIRSRVQNAAAVVELADLLDRKPKALSGGQRQRVALARAIVRTPQVFLMDEPLSNLDAKLRVSMRAKAMTLADRVAVMNKGVIQQLGTPDEIYNDPASLFVAGFIGSPAMNLIEGSLDDGWFIAADGRVVMQVGKGDIERVVLGARPEDVVITEPGAGHVDVIVYALENTGEHVLLTGQLGHQRVMAKGDRQLRKAIDATVGLQFISDRLYLFDPETEQRIRF